jgi:hypothetical protein
MTTMTPKSELEQILTELMPHLPNFINGKEAILQMKNEGSPNWKQMEWIGFWFEHLVSKHLLPNREIQDLSKHGKTTFDLRRKYVWDLKSHPNQTKSLILNDKSAIEECLKQELGLGFIILSGDVEYDQTGDFKKWHDALKGGTSAYEKARVLRNAPSRRRKLSFSPTSINAYWFTKVSQIEACLVDGILGEFQTGMRNSNGKTRKAKIMIKSLDGLNAYSLKSISLK